MFINYRLISFNTGSGAKIRVYCKDSTRLYLAFIIRTYFILVNNLEVLPKIYLCTVISLK